GDPRAPWCARTGGPRGASPSRGRGGRDRGNARRQVAVGKLTCVRAPSSQISAFEKALHITSAVDDAVNDNSPTNDPVNNPIWLVVSFAIFGDAEIHQFPRQVAALGHVGQASPTLLQPFENSIGAFNRITL